MKLIIAIVQDEYANKVIRGLMEEKIRTTKLSSSGGFLKSGNTTLLIGAKEEDIDKIVDIIKARCKSTRVKEGKEEITVGGANMFIVDIDEQVKI